MGGRQESVEDDETARHFVSLIMHVPLRVANIFISFSPSARSKHKQMKSSFRDSRSELHFSFVVELQHFDVHPREVSEHFSLSQTIASKIECRVNPSRFAFSSFSYPKNCSTLILEWIERVRVEEKFVKN